MTYLIKNADGTIDNRITSDEAFANSILQDGQTAELEVLPPPDLWEREPTPEEDRDALLVDLDYRTTLLELEVI